MDLKELESGVNPEMHWYYQSKKVPMIRFFEEVLAQTEDSLTVIDFGAGSGFFALELNKLYSSKIKEIFLVDINYNQDEIEQSANAKVKKVLEVPENVQNAVVLMMDVLEHVPDDKMILKDVLDRLGEDCWYFITVPAFKWLWSNHDEYLGHYRRYTRSMLTRLLKSTGIVPQKRYYIYGAILPLVWLFRKVYGLIEKKGEPASSNMSLTPGVLNTTLKWFNIFEMNFRKLNIFGGVTCVAEGKIK
ncbi:MAG: class I SAM-dependent methyltransferase [Bacteroidota bacterium]